MGRRTSGALLWLTPAVLLCVVIGCSRSHYRVQADNQANCLIEQKASLIGSDPDPMRIDIDPRSRMYSAECPDWPAMPPDDPVAHTFIEQVDCKRGSRLNRHAERTPFVENPDWLAHVPRDEDGALVLDLTAAVDVGLLHSTDYQQNVEELYLSSLDVAFERFRFDCQFFGGSSIFYTADGRDRGGSGGDASSLLVAGPSRSGNRFRVEKLTASGGQLVAGFANSLIWQFAGPNDYTSTTLLDFTLIQPLLRGGGRTLVLERLTIAERALLANVRIMERYRRGFYVNIATGGGSGAGPSRRGGFFGGSGLDGFSGVGGGGFGRVGGGFGGGGGGGGVAGGAGAAAAGGYVGLLQQEQELRNQRANVVALQASVDQLQASFDAGRIDRFQVDLARQALFNAQSQLLTAEAGLQSNIDNFLVDLGLPPNMKIKLSDDLLQPFQLRGEELVALQTEASTLAGTLRGEGEEGDGAEEIDPAENDAAGADAEDDNSGADEPSTIELLPPGPLLADSDGSAQELPQSLPNPEASDSEDQRRFDELAEQSKAQIEAVEQDYQSLLDAAPKRREHLELLAAREELATAQFDLSLLSPERLDGRIEQLRNDFDLLKERFGQLINAPTSKTPLPTPGGDPSLAQKTEGLSALLLELSLLQARARLDTIDIEPTELTDDDALAIALLYRRDIKNSRAALVDSWRLINFNANALMSDLDVTFSGDISNLGDNPLRIRDTTGRLRVGLEFDGPLTRLSERNVYRQALIEFQQARRSYYRFVDRVFQGIRATLRQVRLNEINFELRREAVLVAITQVDLTQLRLSEPPQPGVEQQLSGTTARDLVDALSDLLNVQNDFLSVWVNNEVQMLSLEFNLGVMEIDSSGQRIPLAMPLKDFLYAYPCAEGGGQERSPGDVEPLPLPRIDGDCQPLQLEFTPDLTRLPAASGSAQVLPVSFEEELPTAPPAIQLLPPL